MRPHSLLCLTELLCKILILILKPVALISPVRPDKEGSSTGTLGLGSKVSCKVVENQFRQLSNMNWAQATQAQAG